MRQAIELAQQGRGRVEPNPMVGCLIVRDQQIIGSGFHAHFGGPHAEPAALRSCQSSPANTTAIVTLEPCCHTHKKTPPCVPALIHAGIQRVVIGAVDANPAVAGKGIAQLQAAGIQVIAEVLPQQARQLIAPYLALTQHHRPYVTLKWAQTADGLMGGTGNTPRRISSPAATQMVHQLRTRCDAIAVSVDTVLADDPLLTVRDVPILRTPIRIILDTHLRTPLESRLVRTCREVPLHIFCADYLAHEAKTRELTNLGVSVHFSPTLQNHLDLTHVLHTLGTFRLTHLLVEPGPRLARAFIHAQLPDRIWVIHSPLLLQEPNAPRAPAIPFAAASTLALGPDRLEEYYPPYSPLRFAPPQLITP